MFLHQLIRKYVLFPSPIRAYRKQQSAFGARCAITFNQVCWSKGAFHLTGITGFAGVAFVAQSWNARRWQRILSLPIRTQ